MGVDTSGGHPAMDYEQHVRTYSGFVRGLALIVALIALTLLLLWYFLA
jgi:hypothetical protein